MLQMSMGEYYILSGVTVRNKAETEIIATPDQFCLYWRGYMMAVLDKQISVIKLARALVKWDQQQDRKAKLELLAAARLSEEQRVLKVLGPPSPAAEAIVQ